jgi:hypothetical protein
LNRGEIEEKVRVIVLRSLDSPTINIGIEAHHALATERGMLTSIEHKGK